MTRNRKLDRQTGQSVVRQRRRWTDHQSRYRFFLIENVCIYCCPYRRATQTNKQTPNNMATALMRKLVPQIDEFMRDVWPKQNPAVDVATCYAAELVCMRTL
jgi:hypothetical protein